MDKVEVWCKDCDCVFPLEVRNYHQKCKDCRKPVKKSKKKIIFSQEDKKVTLSFQ